MEKWIFSLGSSQRLSGPPGLAGNVLIVLLGRVPWWPPAKDPVIDEGVAQLLCRVLVSVVLLVKREPSSRLGLLSFSLRFSLNIGLTLGKVWLPQTTSPGLFSWMAAPPYTPSPGSQNTQMPGVFSLPGPRLSAPVPAGLLAIPCNSQSQDPESSPFLQKRTLSWHLNMTGLWYLTTQSR